jgi:DNA-3-methyladenine glycosylase
MYIKPVDKGLKFMNLQKIGRDFYNRKTLVVAQELLGKYIIHTYNKNDLIVRITETEAYCGALDKACHSYGNKKTKRNTVMFGNPGYAYIYLIYGMYYCLNIVTEEEGKPCAVLIRGVEPVRGLEYMAFNRFGKSYDKLNSYQKRNFSNGPGKLCIAMGLNKEYNGVDICKSNLYIAKDLKDYDFEIGKGPRINIDYAEEYKDKPWRFFIK